MDLNKISGDTVQLNMASETQSSLPASSHGEKDIVNSFSEPCAKVRHPVPNLSNKHFTLWADSFYK